MADPRAKLPLELDAFPLAGEREPRRRPPRQHQQGGVHRLHDALPLPQVPTGRGHALDRGRPLLLAGAPACRWATTTIRSGGTSPSNTQRSDEPITPTESTRRNVTLYPAPPEGGATTHRTTGSHP